MGYAVEVGFQVRIVDLCSPCLEVFTDRFQRIMRLATRPESIRAFAEVRLKDGFQYQHNRHLYYPVFQSRDSKRSFLSVGFRDVNPPYGAGLIGLFLEFPMDPGKEFFHTVFSLQDALGSDLNGARIWGLSRDLEGVGGML